MTKEEKQAIIKEYAVHEGDTGSAQVQVAVLTKRINVLTSTKTMFTSIVILSQSSVSVILSSVTWLTTKLKTN